MTEKSSGKKTVSVSKIQRLIGERMLESKRTKPCFYIEAKANVSELMGMRHGLRKKLGVKITTNAFYIRAIAMAVKEYPLVVGVVDGDNIKIAERINIGFAVNAPQGLVVPIVKDADKKTLAEIAELEKELTERGRSNQLTLEEVEGETIALSNLGVYGIDSFIGIVPPPVSTIMAVGNVINEAVPVDGKIEVQKRVSLTLAVDHRVINGRYAAEFLNFIVEELQHPQQLI